MQFSQNFVYFLIENVGFFQTEQKYLKFLKIYFWPFMPEPQQISSCRPVCMGELFLLLNSYMGWTVPLLNSYMGWTAPLVNSYMAHWATNIDISWNKPLYPFRQHRFKTRVFCPNHQYYLSLLCIIFRKILKTN